MCKQWLLLLALYLGLHQGYLALWNSDIPEPVAVFPYRAEVYPKIDQAALDSGIPVENQAHFKALMEDFLS